MKPDAPLADEPTGDLEDGNTTAVLALPKGTAMLLVTHEQEAARTGGLPFSTNVTVHHRFDQ